LSVIFISYRDLQTFRLELQTPVGFEEKIESGEQRIYSTDTTGNRQYDKSAFKTALILKPFPG